MKKHKQLVGAIVFLIAALFCMMAITWYAKQQIQDIYVLRDGWNISFNRGASVPQITKDLSDYTFSGIKKGDIICLERSLEDISFDEGTLVLDTWHVVLNVYLDGECIYSHGAEYRDAGKMVGNIRHYVMLPEEIRNQTLRLEMTCTADNAMSGLMPIGIAKEGDLSIFWFNRLFPLLVPSVIIISVGFVIMFLGLLLYSRKNLTYRVAFLGMLMFFVGLYSLCRAQFIGTLIPNPLIYNAIEYCSLYVLPVSLIYLFRGEVDMIEHKVLRYAYKGILIFSVVFAAVTTLLHVFNIVHYVEFLDFFYVLILLEIVIMLLVSLTFVKKNKGRGKFYVVAVIMILIGGLLAIFAFRLRYTPLNELLHIWQWQEYLFVIFFFAGGLFGAIALVQEASHVLYDSLYSSMYKEIAYTDALTGLGNRRSFDEELQWLEQNKDSTAYGIVCFDLNDLKKINDTKGHDAGDILLRAFAGALQSACQKEVFAYRVGGDEFVAVIRDTRLFDMGRFTERIEEEIQVANLEHANIGIKVSAAYGIAEQGENESVHKVYMLADERMYEKKAEMKAAE